MTSSGIVLIVEDERDTRESLAELLQLFGYQTRVAENGKRALEILRQDGMKPCVILLDLMMPVMSGWEFREIQRKDPTISSIPVVVVTADVTAEERAHPFEFAGFLKKPVSFEQLSEAVAAFC